jgi:hypothetical protein
MKFSVGRSGRHNHHHRHTSVGKLIHAREGDYTTGTNWVLPSNQASKSKRAVQHCEAHLRQLGARGPKFAAPRCSLHNSVKTIATVAYVQCPQEAAGTMTLCNAAVRPAHRGTRSRKCSQTKCSCARTGRSNHNWQLSQTSMHDRHLCKT